MTPEKLLEKVRSPGSYFKLHMGTELASLDELRDSLKSMNNTTFNHHVNEHKNDFASWVLDVIKDKELAKNLNRTQKKDETLKIVNSRILWLKNKVGANCPYVNFTCQIKEFVTGLLTGIFLGFILARMIGWI